LVIFFAALFARRSLNEILSSTRNLNILISYPKKEKRGRGESDRENQILKTADMSIERMIGHQPVGERGGCNGIE
jgi:hypothetical protein